MIFLTLLLFIISTTQSSSNFSKPPMIDFGGSSGFKADQSTIKIKAMTENWYSIQLKDNFLNQKIAEEYKAGVGYREDSEYPHVCVEIDHVTDILKIKPSHAQLEKAIKILEKIKRENTKIEFEFEGKKTIDPFRIAWASDHLVGLYSESIIIEEILPCSIGFSLAATALRYFCSNFIGANIPLFIFFAPFITFNKYAYYYAKHRLNSKSKLLNLTLFMVPLALIYGINRLI